MSQELKTIIDEAFEKIDSITPQTTGDLAIAVEKALLLLDSGAVRISEKVGNDWVVNAWLKKAVLLSFRLNKTTVMDAGIGQAYDKVPLKYANWSEAQFSDAGFRAVPGSVVRQGSFIGKGVVLMPSFVNIGAFVDEGTMVDTWTTVGSCAQIGKNVHLSGGVGIGGVLEPLQASPVVIEDNCFIGARSEVAEGVIVRKGAVISMGVYLGQSTKIVDRATGEITYGEVPEGAVVVPGTVAGKIKPDGSQDPSLYAAVIVKRVDEKTRAKTSINQLLRD